MTQLITLLSLLVAVFAMCAYFRMARVSDKNIAQANKQLDFLNRWRKRYSRRVHKFVDEMNAKDKQIENIKAILRKELEDGRERDVVMNHFRNKYHAQQDAMATMAEYFYLNKKGDCTKKDYKRIDELGTTILVDLVNQGYEDLRPLLPKKLRNMKSLRDCENITNAKPIVLYPGREIEFPAPNEPGGTAACPPDHVVR
jgi:hypothetical protein